MFDDFLVEARTTDAKTYSISGDEFQKVATEAIKAPPGCLPAMQVTIQGLDLWVMRLADFDALHAELTLYRNSDDLS